MLTSESSSTSFFLYLGSFFLPAFSVSHFTNQLNQNPFASDESITRASNPPPPFPHPLWLHPVTQLTTSLCVSHPCFTKLSQPCVPSDTRTFPLSSRLNKYVLWTPSQNTLAHTHAYSQSAPLLDIVPEDSKGAMKVERVYTTL